MRLFILNPKGQPPYPFIIKLRWINLINSFKLKLNLDWVRVEFRLNWDSIQLKLKLKLDLNWIETIQCSAVRPQCSAVHSAVYCSAVWCIPSAFTSSCIPLNLKLSLALIFSFLTQQSSCLRWGILYCKLWDRPGIYKNLRIYAINI